MSPLLKSNLPVMATVIAYLVGVTVLGVWIGRKNSKTKEGYFLGGRKFNWFMIGFSLFATNVGVGVFIGGSGMAYRIGAAAMIPDLLGSLGLTLSAVLFVPIFLRSSITTLPQFLERRFNRWAKFFYGTLFVLLAVAVSPLNMYTGSLAVLSMFGFEINVANIYITSFLIASTVGVYSIMGGLTAVVVTDMVQVVIMVASSLAISIIGIMKIGGLGELFQGTPPEMLELIRPHNDPQFPWSAMLTGQLLASCLWAFSNITMLQRVLGAKNQEHAQSGMLLGAGMKMFGFILYVIPGIIAARLFPHIAPDTAFSTLTRELLPAGLSGIVMAGMLAALMSTQDSSVNAMASVVSIDLYPAVRRKASERETIIVGKIVATGMIVWGLAAAPIFLVVEQGIFSLLLKFGGFMMLPNGLCYLLGRFWRRGTAPACISTLVGGAALGAYYIFASTIPGYGWLLPDWIAHMHFYHLLPFLAVLLTAVFVAVSLFTPPPSREKLEILDEGQTNLAPAQAERRPWYRRYAFWWTLYLIAFAAIWYIF